MRIGLKVGQSTCLGLLCLLTLKDKLSAFPQSLGGPVLLMIINQRNGFPVLGKDTLIGDTYISQKDREKIYNCKVLFVYFSNKWKREFRDLDQVLVGTHSKLFWKP